MVSNHEARIEQQWPPDPFELPVAVAGMNTAILVSSSFTMHWALEGARNDNHRAMKMGLFTTALLGLTFLTIQINEYFHIGFAISENAETTIFYSLTGLHGAHVFVGLTTHGKGESVKIAANFSRHGFQALDHDVAHRLNATVPYGRGCGV